MTQQDDSRSTRQGAAPGRAANITYLKQAPESWLARQDALGAFSLAGFPALARIEDLAAKTQELGPQPLWEGYGQGDASRTSNRVRTGRNFGVFYHRLVLARTPDVIVEVGTAFGVSGMFWLSGLQANNRGHLYTFDPNDVWRKIAVGNLGQIGDRFTSVHGTFEDHHAATLSGQPVDICFIDAIHTSEFVYPQFELLRKRMRPGGIMVLDDIRFSEDMMQCWNELAMRPDVICSLEIGSRVGVIEIGQVDV